MASSSRSVAFVAGILFAAVAARSQDLINPDRPGIADGSTTIRRGAVQIEAGIERDDQRSLGVEQRILSTPALLRSRVRRAGMSHWPLPSW